MRPFAACFVGLGRLDALISVKKVFFLVEIMQFGYWCWPIVKNDSSELAAGL